MDLEIFLWKCDLRFLASLIIPMKMKVTYNNASKPDRLLSNGH
jgi:hypothetical protein